MEIPSINGLMDDLSWKISSTNGNHHHHHHHHPFIDGIFHDKSSCIIQRYIKGYLQYPHFWNSNFLSSNLSELVFRDDLDCTGAPQRPSEHPPQIRYWLVGDLEPIFFFHSVGNVIIPTDFHSIIFQRGRAQPPTRLLLSLTIYINHIYIYIYINH